MSESPPKRRKTSPTTSVAVNAPTLSSQHATSLSFASPTRASTARRDAQLTSRGISPEKQRDEQAGRSTIADNAFAKTVDERAVEVGGNVRGTPKTRALGGGLSAKPRRMSRSPVKGKQVVERAIEPPLDLEGVTNPFQKRGLRRSPVSSQSEGVRQEAQPMVEETNPFQRRGLRRSPIASRDSVPSQPPRTDDVRRERFTTTPPGLPPTRARRDTATLPEVNANEASPVPEQEKMSPEKVVRAQSMEAPVQLEKGDVQPDTPTPIPLPGIGIGIGSVEMPETAEAQLFVSDGPEAQPSGNVDIPPAAPLTKPHPKKTPKISKALSKAQSTNTTKASSRPQATVEPDLPLTPTQRGLADPVVTTPPSGIHNTPSKRQRARAKSLKSSPLKPRDEHPQEGNQDAKAAGARASRPEPQVEIPTKQKELFKRRRSARFLIPEDPHAEKKAQRDALLRELQELQADIKIGNQETERLRLLQQISKNASPSVPSKKDSEDLTAMLLRSVPKPAQQETPPSTPKSIFDSINSFLPFHRRNGLDKDLPVVVQKTLEKPLPSFLPLHQADPLPFLQAFSPLNYTSTIDLLPPTPASSSPSASPPSASRALATLQEHTITATHPSNLFLARLSLIVQTSNHTIHSLSVLKLDSAAESELGSFLAEKAAAKEISVVGWAMGRWAETAIARARFWCQVEAEFESTAARSESLQDLRSKSRKRKRAAMADVEEEEEEDEVGEVNAEVEKKKSWSRRDLLPHMGRTSLDISSVEGDDEDNENVLLRIEWKLVFDWTGEVESLISASAQVPSSWRAQDSRNSLSTIPVTFQKLVKQKGPLNAVRSIAALLFSES